MIDNQLKVDLKKSCIRLTNSFDKRIKHMNFFGDDKSLPLYALIFAILTALVIDLVIVLLSYLP